MANVVSGNVDPAPVSNVSLSARRRGAGRSWNGVNCSLCSSSSRASQPNCKPSRGSTTRASSRVSCKPSRLLPPVPETAPSFALSFLSTSIDARKANSCLASDQILSPIPQLFDHFARPRSRHFFAPMSGRYQLTFDGCPGCPRCRHQGATGGHFADASGARKGLPVGLFFGQLPP